MFAYERAARAIAPVRREKRRRANGPDAACGHDPEPDGVLELPESRPRAILEDQGSDTVLGSYAPEAETRELVEGLGPGHRHAVTASPGTSRTGSRAAGVSILEET